MQRACTCNKLLAFVVVIVGKLCHDGLLRRAKDTRVRGVAAGVSALASTHARQVCRV